MPDLSVGITVQSYSNFFIWPNRAAVFAENRAEDCDINPRSPEKLTNCHRPPLRNTFFHAQKFGANEDNT